MVDWVKLEAALKEEFRSKNERWFLERELQTKHQFTDENVVDYAAGKRLIMDRINPHMDEATRLHHFFLGLAPYLQERVWPEDPKSFDEAVKLAEKYERASKLAGGNVNVNHISHTVPTWLGHQPTNEYYYQGDMDHEVNVVFTKPNNNNKTNYNNNYK